MKVLGNTLLTCPYESENVYRIINKKVAKCIGDINLTCKSFIINSNNLVKDGIDNFLNFHKGKVPVNTEVEVFCNGSQILLVKLNDIMYIHNKWIDMLPR